MPLKMSFIKYSESKVLQCVLAVRKNILKNFAKFIGKHLRQSLFFNKVAGLGLIYRLHLRYIFTFSHRNICDTMRDLVLFEQFKKREKHPWMSITFSKVAGFRLSRFLNRTIGIKSSNASKSFL